MEEVGYNIQMTLRDALTGEIITVTTDAAKESSAADLQKIVDFVTHALEERNERPVEPLQSLAREAIVQMTKQIALTGETISMSTLIPAGSLQDQISAILGVISDGMERRLVEMNDRVLARTGQNLEELGLGDKIPGFGKKGNGEAHE